MIAGHYVIPEVNFKYKIDNCVTFMKKKINNIHQIQYF